MGCDTGTIACVCGAAYLRRVAACEQISCSEADRQSMLTLDVFGGGGEVFAGWWTDAAIRGEELCYPFYNSTPSGPSIASAASAAVAEATAAAAAAVTAKDETDPGSYPACAVGLMADIVACASSLLFCEKM